MKGSKEYHGSGKTRFNRGKKKGESWTKLREEARKAGQYTPPKKKEEENV